MWWASSLRMLCWDFITPQDAESLQGDVWWVEERLVGPDYASSSIVCVPEYEDVSHVLRFVVWNPLVARGDLLLGPPKVEGVAVSNVTPLQVDTMGSSCFCP